MAKRKRVASQKEDSKCRDKQSSIDLISMLGDDVLVSILSRLTFKEAIATSILSRRWRYLWTFMPKLDFDGTKLLLKVMSEKRKRESLDNERASYVRCVDRGLSSQDSDIEEFRVFFNLTKTHKSSVSEWLRYALARKVQRLELDLTDYGSRSSRKYDECYTFPYELLRKCDSIDFKYLKKLSMNYVNVDGEALVFFLSNCPLLEDLSVSQSGDLKSLEITGPFPSFKRLSICFCQNLNSVEIRDTNFVSFKYEGSRINMLLKNVPQLVEIFVGGTVTDNMGDVLFMFSSCLPQLEILTIQKMDHFGWMETRIFHSMVEMSNLKQLVVKVDSYLFGDQSLLPITNLIHASPCLQKFVLEVLRLEPEYVKKKVNQIAGSYPHLKEVEFVGYHGLNSELELVMHFLENAAALENIIINPRKPCDSPFGPRPYATPYGYNWKYYPKFKEDFISEEMSARTRAKKQLMKKVPPGINLKIL